MTPIHTDNLHRIAYATDASAYRQMPYGVAFPQTPDDIPPLIAEARRRHLPLIPRAAGTSIAGQVVGSGIVVDVSRYLNNILEINPQQRWVRLQPGVVRDELNSALKPYGLFFSPETSTSNRCCVGGMVGNNSCGTHSLVYGSTRHHLLQVKGFLSDGSPFDTALPPSSPLQHAIYDQLRLWQNDTAVRETIALHFPDPSLQRRSCGYAIDEAIADDKIDLCKVICGSEGTLCFVTELKLSLDPLPPANSLLVCAHCTTLEQSFQGNLVALRHNPVAVELLDGKILLLAKSNPATLRDRFFVQGDPAALLIAEFAGPDALRHADAFEADILANGLAYSCPRLSGHDVARVWNLRKAGLGVLSCMKGDAKPVGVIEDTAVAPARLPEYMADFRAMLDSLNLDCVYYGHISTGELHLRPILNLKTTEGRRLFRLVAQQTALLVRKHAGTLSGEHGDGRLRGEFIPLLYGDECYRLMCQLKHTWDPDGLFNPGKIVDAPPMDADLRFDAPHRYLVEGHLPTLAPSLSPFGATFYNWKAAFDQCRVPGVSGVRDQWHALLCSVEQCNGAGVCRKGSAVGGAMCPAFMVSDRDELLSTRARANVLRELLTYGLSALATSAKPLDAPSPLTLREVEEVLSSCLACKGCKGECPSEVDMTRIRSELLQQLYLLRGVPLRTWMVARMAAFESLGARIPHLYNLAASWRLSAAIIKRLVSFAPQRSIPLLHPSHLTLPALPTHARKVFFFLDEFTRYHEPHLAQTFVDLLARLGYQVVIPKHVESGRTAISKGCLSLARRHAIRNVTLLKDLVTHDTPLVGIEPSCILSFRDEYPDLVPDDLRDDAQRLADNSLLFDEFMMREVANGRISSAQFAPTPCDIWLHGHCHQKALVGIELTAAMLRLIPQATVHVIPSSCCGMAGSFGYEKEHYKTSLAIGEMFLFPAVRKAVADTSSALPAFVVAPGTSCRQQILDGTGVTALHPIALLSRFVLPD